MKEKYKKTCKYLNYDEPLLILASTITSCTNQVLINFFIYFISLFPVGIMSSAVRIKICAINAGIKEEA